jgi:hypothetical protein
MNSRFRRRSKSRRSTPPFDSSAGFATAASIVARRCTLRAAKLTGECCAPVPRTFPRPASQAPGQWIDRDRERRSGGGVQSPHPIGDWGGGKGERENRHTPVRFSYWGFTGGWTGVTGHRDGAARARLQSHARHEHHGAWTADRGDADIGGRSSNCSRRTQTPETAERRARAAPRQQNSQNWQDEWAKHQRRRL